MPITCEPLAIPDVKLITPARFGDQRGFFSEVFNALELAAHGIDSAFVQDNHSMSGQVGVIRGLHFQAPPAAQGKLVRVTRGSVLDVALDIRKNSPTYGKHVSAVLSADNWQQLWVPPGFAHGFCVREEGTEFLYKVTAPYAPETEGGVRFDDPDLAIDWGVEGTEAVLSDKDSKLPLWSQFQSPF